MSLPSRTQAMDDRYFSPNPQQKQIAQFLYEMVAGLPLVCPHGHVDPRMFADPNYSFGSPADLFIIPDHYVFRMLYSQGIPLEKLGIVPRDGSPVETDHRKIWQTFADNFFLFRGTPTGMWMKDELRSVFGIEATLNGETAQDIYDLIMARLAEPEYRPRRLYDRFNIELLCTTDPATSSLEYHYTIRESGWHGRILPTFRPDDVINLDAPSWSGNLEKLEDLTGQTVHDYHSFILALETRRAAFRELGAKATDHDALTPYAESLSDAEVERIFQKALADKATQEDARQFKAHMLMESARMSIEDGLVMQLHTGSFRNHNRTLYDRFGPDKGSDTPVAAEFTRSLHTLLNKFGNDPRLTLILFTLDESTYTRELAPLAGHYPAVKLGPPWWFNDSPNGMVRYRQRVIETTGLYNTVGFNDDTRAFPSIPARHDLSRRMDADWLAGLVVRSIVDLNEAKDMIQDTAYRLAKKAYKFDDTA